MYQTIILPVDVNNSEKAAAMVDAAEKLGDESTKIILLNIIEEIPIYVAVHMPEGYAAQTKSKAVEALNRIAKSTSFDTEIEVRGARQASAEILDCADEKKADAIIIASHRPGFEDYLLGSTASRVVRHANCSVLVIR